MKNNSIIYFLLSIWLFSCSKKEEAVVEVEASIGIVFLSSVKEKNAGIVLDSLKTIELDETIKANGIVDVPPQHLASVSTLMAGYIAESTVLRGQHVHKGEVLATLRNSTYIDIQQEYVRENSKLVFMEEEYNRQKEMLAYDVTAKRDFQQAESNYQSQKAFVKSLEEKVKMLGLSAERVKSGEISPVIHLISPINGFVKSSNASIGKYCLPEVVLFEITDISHMHLELKVFEQDIAKVEKGQKVIFYQPSLEAKKMVGEVYLVGKSLDPVTRTVGVHVHFEESQSPAILPGMYISAIIESNTRKVKVLPEKAVFKSGEKGYVFALKNETPEGRYFEKRLVEIGLSNNGFDEILNAESLSNKKIATEGAYYLNAEMMKPEE